MGKNSEIRDLIEALKNQNEERSEGSFATPKNVNYLVLGVLAAVGALVWNTVVTAPSNFGQLSQQNAEIRTTVLEMKSSLTSLNAKLEENQRQSADQSAAISALQNQAQTNKNNIENLAERVNDMERRR